MGSGAHDAMDEWTQHNSLTMCRFPISANWRLLCTQNSVVRCCRCAQPEAAVHHDARRKASRERRAWGYPKRAELEAATRNLAILDIPCGGWRMEFLHRRRYTQRDCRDRPRTPTRRVRGKTSAAKTCRVKLCGAALLLLESGQRLDHMHQRACSTSHPRLCRAQFPLDFNTKKYNFFVAFYLCCRRQLCRVVQAQGT